jgi:hypothetical protein
MRPPDPSRLKADTGPPGSRVRCFRTCSGSTTAQGLTGSRAIDPTSFAFHLSHSVSTLKLNRISRLHTRPARTPVNASPPPSRAEAHDSGPMWLATPSSYDSFIHYTLPVLPGAFGTSYIPPVKRKVKNKSESRDIKRAIFSIDLSLQSSGGLFCFFRRISHFDELCI